MFKKTNFIVFVQNICSIGIRFLQHVPIKLAASIQRCSQVAKRSTTEDFLTISQRPSSQWIMFILCRIFSHCPSWPYVDMMLTSNRKIHPKKDKIHLLICGHRALVVHHPFQTLMHFSKVLLGQTVWRVNWISVLVMVGSGAVCMYYLHLSDVVIEAQCC